MNRDIRVFGMAMITNEVLGRRIKNYRMSAGLSQLELEVQIGFPSGQISRLETGKVNPTKETISKIAIGLNLNSRQVDYLLGTSSKSVEESEISQAIRDVHAHFSKKGVWAYLLDDRGRIFKISDSFKKLGNITELKMGKIYGLPLPIVLLEPELGFKEFFPDEMYEEIIADSLIRTYADIGYMKDDEDYKRTLEYIRKYPLLSDLWDEYEKAGAPTFSTSENSIVTFAYMKYQLKMEYRIETLVSSARFRVYEYRPVTGTGKLLKILLDRVW